MLISYMKNEIALSAKNIILFLFILITSVLNASEEMSSDITVHKAYSTAAKGLACLSEKNFYLEWSDVSISESDHQKEIFPEFKESPFSVHGQVITSFKKKNADGKKIKMRKRSLGTLVGPQHILVSSDSLYIHTINSKDQEEKSLIEMKKWARSAIFIPASQSGEINNDDQNPAYNGHALLCPQEWIDHEDASFGYGMIILDQSPGIGWAGVKTIEKQDLTESIVTSLQIKSMDCRKRRDRLQTSPCQIKEIVANHLLYTPQQVKEGLDGVILLSNPVKSNGFSIIGFERAKDHIKNDSEAVKMTSPIIDHIIQWRKGNYPNIENQKRFKTLKYQAHLPEVKFDLARCYWNGFGIKENWFKAYKLYREITDLKTSSNVKNQIINESNERLGDYYHLLLKKPELAICYYKEAQTNYSLFMVGHIYMELNKDKKAFKWFKQVAKKENFTLCQIAFAQRLEANEFPPQKYIKQYIKAYTIFPLNDQFKYANQYLEKASKEKNKFKAQELKNEVKEWFIKLAEQGHYESILKILSIYEEEGNNSLDYKNWCHVLANYKV